MLRKPVNQKINNKVMKRLLQFTAALLILQFGIRDSEFANAQDIHFSQFYENAILRNPGLTGIFSGDYKAGVNYRTQWGNISNPFQTVIASVETRVAVSQETDDYLSFGLSTSYDHAGSISFNSLQIFPAINYNKSLTDEHQSYLSLGFAGGYIQRSYDASKITVDNQWNGSGFDPNAATHENLGNKISHWDISAGVSFNSSLGEDNNINYYIGAAAWHVSHPKEAFNGNETLIRLSTKYVGSLGFMWHVDNAAVGVSFHANYLNQNPYQETTLGGFLSWKNTVSNTQPKAFGLYAGCFYRVKDAVIPTDQDRLADVLLYLLV